ncbi:hypothetical protein EN45_089790 [Penicillium chrysogenum]|uniref:Uncharacterized protein n=1 Tax=Penicillium chrysogenum TaxID=5076 RepID=A0A167QIZ4_PENCH|nr:hypothetical protein EN45_089790 [Penicillium chrysogenum]
MSHDAPYSIISTATKAEIKRLAGDSCWVCQSTDSQICDVIGKEDKQAEPESKRVKQDPTRMDKPEDTDGNSFDHQQNRARAFKDEWVLGPDLTIQEAICRYAPGFTHH